MSMLLAAAAILVTAPAAPVSQVDAAYEDLAASRNEQAIARIEAADEAADHPAGLINLAIAYARQGDTERARRALERAARYDRRADLETASGEWVDSRKLALRALAALDWGELRPHSRTARR